MSTTDVYLMSPPSLGWSLRGKANFRSASAPAVDARRARAEWIALADAIEARGGRVVCLVPPSDTVMTGLPYAAECGQIVEREGELLFLLPNMAVEHRRGERALWRGLAERMNIRTVTLPGIWEAQGDVATFDDCTLLFYGGRTDRVGMAAARPYFGDDVIELRLRQPAFHGNMAVLPLPAVDRLVVCVEVICDDGIDRLYARFGHDRIVAVTEAEIRCYATNGLPIGTDLLAPHLVPVRVRDALERCGMNIVTLAMHELCEKAGGASRCLVSYARVPADRLSVPADADYRQRRSELVAEAAP